VVLGEVVVKTVVDEVEVVVSTEVVEVVSSKDSNKGSVSFNVLFPAKKPVNVKLSLKGLVNFKSKLSGLMITMRIIKVMTPRPTENRILLV